MIREGGVIAAAAAAIALALAPAASAAPGDLTYQGCITGDEAVGPTGSDACAAIPTASLIGEESGFDRPESVATSPDGTSVYLASGDGDDAVVHFRRDLATGGLTYAGCITGDSDVDACTEIPDATSGGDDSGLDYPEGVTVSPDGTSVYLNVRFDDSIAHFERDPATGALTFAGCITGEDDVPCTQLDDASPDGENSGLDDPKSKSVVVTADGSSLYAVSEADKSVLHFDRSTSTGALTFVECITGETETTGCDQIPNASSNGEASGLFDPRWITSAPGDTSIYVFTERDDSVAMFGRDTSTGELTYNGCITGNTDVGPANASACDGIPSGAPGGTDSGLGDVRAGAVSPDGEFLYAVTEDDASVARFDRNTSTGILTYLDCVTGDADVGPDGSDACAEIPAASIGAEDSGIDGPRSTEVSADGLTLYGTAQFDDSVFRFDIDPATGALTYNGCVTGEEESAACAQIPSAAASGADSGLDGAETLALTGDGRSLYVAAEDDDAVARFDREPAPPAPPAPPETARCQGDTIPKQNGTSGNDDLTGTSGKDAIFGLGGNDRIRGVTGPDCLEGDPGRDIVKGGGGKDRLKGDGGRDKLRGQGGKDRLNGGGGKDKLNGGEGKDSLRGGAGKDKLRGGPAKDKLRGNGGKDRINAVDRKKDKVNCGGGRDKVTVDPSDKVASNCERVREKD